MTGKKRAYIKVALFICVLVIILYRWHTRVEDDTWFRQYENRKAHFDAVIIDDPEYKNEWQRFKVSIIPEVGGRENEKKTLESGRSNVTAVPQHYMLLRSRNAHFEYGDKISFSAKVEKPEIIVSEDGREFDYRAYLSKDDVYYIASTQDALFISSISEHKQVSRLIYYLYKGKNQFLENINKSLPSPHSFLAGGLVISGKGSLDKELQTQFQKVGLIHIVVLSGFNISIVGEAIMRCLAFLPPFIGAFFGCICIVLFSVMTGGGATVVRSAIMSFIAVFARLTGRVNSAMTSLMIAGSLMLIHNPKLAVYDPSFQLSFVATTGLILFSEPIEVRLRALCGGLSKRFMEHSTVSALLALVSSTLATQIFTLPLIMRFSGVVSLIALPVNIIVLPFIPVTMLFVFITGMAGFISSFTAVLPAFVSYALLAYELAVVRYFSGFSLSAIQLGTMSKLYVLQSYIALITIYVFVRNPKGRKEEGSHDETLHTPT